MNDGILLLAATPLGDVKDASTRLVEALSTADVIAAEDTRRTRHLASALGVTPRGRIVSFYDAVETARLPGLVDAVREGHTVLLVTDAGMPSVSDPGFRLAAACADAGLRVSCLPGPSAVTTALAISGLPCDRFCFEGFAPRKDGERRRWLAELVREPRTAVFFESPHRLKDTIEMMKETDLLVFDDIGAENMNPWLRDHVLGSILNYRMNRKPTFYTSNYDLERLEAHFSFTSKEGEDEGKGQRLMERIRPFIDVVVVSGSNKRGLG